MQKLDKEGKIVRLVYNDDQFKLESKKQSKRRKKADKYRKKLGIAIAKNKGEAIHRDLVFIPMLNEEDKVIPFVRSKESNKNRFKQQLNAESYHRKGRDKTKAKDERLTEIRKKEEWAITKVKLAPSLRKALEIKSVYVNPTTFDILKKKYIILKNEKKKKERKAKILETPPKVIKKSAKQLVKTVEKVLTDRVKLTTEVVIKPNYPINVSLERFRQHLVENERIVIFKIGTKKVTIDFSKFTPEGRDKIRRKENRKLNSIISHIENIKKDKIFKYTGENTEILKKKKRRTEEVENLEKLLRARIVGIKSYTLNFPFTDYFKSVKGTVSPEVLNILQLLVYEKTFYDYECKNYKWQSKFPTWLPELIEDFYRKVQVTKAVPIYRNKVVLVSKAKKNAWKHHNHLLLVAENDKKRQEFKLKTQAKTQYRKDKATLSNDRIVTLTKDLTLLRTSIGHARDLVLKHGWKFVSKAAWKAAKNDPKHPYTLLTEVGRINLEDIPAKERNLKRQAATHAKYKAERERIVNKLERKGHVSKKSRKSRRFVQNGTSSLEKASRQNNRGARSRG